MQVQLPAAENREAAAAGYQIKDGVERTHLAHFGRRKTSGPEEKVIVKIRLHHLRIGDVNQILKLPRLNEGFLRKGIDFADHSDKIVDKERHEGETAMADVRAHESNIQLA